MSGRTVLPSGPPTGTGGPDGRTDWDALTRRVNNATYAAWNAHDPDAVAALLAEDVRIRESSSPEWSIGRASVRARAAALFAAFSDFRLERLTLLIDGPRHSDRWVMSGTHDGEFQGIPPTGRAIRVEGATFTVLREDGFVSEDIHHTDYYSVFQQLGLVD
jgi:steroid delta-isomerase-like uncharacterized protein